MVAHYIAKKLGEKIQYKIIDGFLLKVAKSSLIYECASGCFGYSRVIKIPKYSIRLVQF